MTLTVHLEKLINLLDCCSVVVSVTISTEKVVKLLGCCSAVVSVTVHIEKVMNLLACCSVVVSVVGGGGGVAGFTCYNRIKKATTTINH